MADPHGFLDHPARELPERRPVPVRILDHREISLPQDRAQLQRQASRCMDCGIPFCHQGCPLGNLIPEWNDLARRGELRAASERLHATNNFPELTGRLCPAPCESSCVLGISQPAVTIKRIEQSIADAALEGEWLEPRPPERLTGRTVAVVGSGPAGLAAAQQLVRAGHTVAVFERDDRIGGLLRYGIPDFKLDKQVLEQRLAQLRAEGVRFRPGVEIGRDLGWDELRRRYDAIVIATGAPVARPLGVPGEHLDGVVDAMPYLVAQNRRNAGDEVVGAPDAAGRRVIVIGGGDTGADCLGTSLRQGAASVTQLEIMSRPGEERPAGQPWPTYPMLFRVSSAHEEGGERVYAVSTQEFVGDDEGHVKALRLVEVDAAFQPVEGTEREIPADLVLLAMGFLGPEQPGLVEQLGVELDERGNVVRNDDYESSVPGVFVAGDAGRGQSLIVWAIAEGRSAAASVDRFLTGGTELPAPIKPYERPLTV